MASAEYIIRIAQLPYIQLLLDSVARLASTFACQLERGSASEENVIRPAVCPPHCSSDKNVFNAPPSRDDEVNLMPVFGAWMHPS